MPLPPERDPATLFNNLVRQGRTAPDGRGCADAYGDLQQASPQRTGRGARRRQSLANEPGFGRREAHRRSHGERTCARDAHSHDAGRRQSSADRSGVPVAGDFRRTQAANLDLAKVTATSKVMNKLIAAALSCNMTPGLLALVVRRARRQPLSDHPARYRAPHAHAQRRPRCPNAKAAKIEKYIMSQYADLAQTLKDTPMGAGNAARQHDHLRHQRRCRATGHLMKNYHIVLMGHAGGKIRATATSARHGGARYRAHAHASASHGHEGHLLRHLGQDQHDRSSPT